MIERRISQRFELSLPVKIQISAQSDAQAYDGKTSDISPLGVHFIVENGLNVGAELNLTVTLPAEVTGGAEVLVQTKSTVLRVEKSSANGDCRVRVAALFRQCEIVRNKSARTVSLPTGKQQQPTEGSEPEPVGRKGQSASSSRDCRRASRDGTRS